MKILLSAAALCGMMTSANAQAFEFKSATFTLSYEQFSYPDGRDEASKSFSSTLDVGFGGQFGLGAALNTHDLSNYPEETYYSLTLRPYYTVSTELDVGLILEKNFSEYSGGAGHGILYGFDVAYYAPNGFAATGYVATGQDFRDIDADFAGLTVGYGFANGFDFGAYAKTTRYDGGVDVTRTGLTAGYLFASDSLPVPVYLSGYIGTQEYTGSHDTMGLSLTIPVGTARLGKGQRPSANNHDTLYEYYN